MVAAIYKVIDEEVPPSQVIDATALSGNPEVFADHIHLTEVGAARVADVVAAGVLRDLAAQAKPSGR